MKLKVNNQLYVSPVMNDKGRITGFIYKYEILEFNNKDEIVNQYFIQNNVLNQHQRDILNKFDYLDINDETVQDIYLYIKNQIIEEPMSNVPFDSDYIIDYFNLAERFYPNIKKNMFDI